MEYCKDGQHAMRLIGATEKWKTYGCARCPHSYNVPR